MIYTLASHSKAYSLSLNEWTYSTLTGLRAPFFAQRHFELSHETEGCVKWGHKIIGTLEMIPVIGAFSALIEKITCFALMTFGYQATPLPIPQPATRTTSEPAPKPPIALPPPAALPTDSEAPPSKSGGQRRRQNSSPLKKLETSSLELATRKSPVGFTSPKINPPIAETEALIPEELTSPRPIHPQPSKLDKMIKNCLKALREHVDRQTPTYRTKAAYISEEELEEILAPMKTTEGKVQSSILWPQVSRDERKGKKPTMEDFSFEEILDEGTLSGIFDGHAGARAAAYANLQFPRNFSKALKTFDGNIFEAMSELLRLIDEKILAHESRKQSGCTALICFLDRKTHILYTATLGDTEAVIYRKNAAGELKAIPVSCVRDWSYKKEALRASIALKTETIATSWPARHASDLYFPSFEDSKDELNVSRALGDAPFRGPKETPGVIAKPKITAFPLKEGDHLVMASDGLWSVAHNADVIDFLTKTRKPKESSWAELLAEDALHRDSGDNVTVITWEVQEIPGFGRDVEAEVTTPRPA